MLQQRQATIWKEEERKEKVRRSRESEGRLKVE